MDLFEYAKLHKVLCKGGGGNSADVRYVTFMNGETVLYIKPVAVGDDCVNVVTKGLVEAPTKESTPEYTYTYSGWSLTDGGTADSNALKSVTENRTVYASFTESVRNYTVNFYDGETLLNSVKVAYGGSYEYAYSKDNYLLTGWLPEPTNITGDMDCYAQLEESYTFADASWEYIADISARGLASSAFALGDTKDVEVVDVAGRTHTLQFHIVGFNHDDLADGSGKAGISIVSKDAFRPSSDHSNGDTKGFWRATSVVAHRFIGRAGWEASEIRTGIQTTFMNGVPAALKNVIKEVTKQYDLNDGSTIYTCNDTVWIPSATELLGGGYYLRKYGTQYEYYAVADNRKKTTLNADGIASTTVNYGTRSACTYQASASSTYNVGVKGDTGEPLSTSSGPNYREMYYAPIGFCI